MSMRAAEEARLVVLVQDTLEARRAALAVLRAEIARRLHRDRSFVTRFFRRDGQHQTLANAAAVAWALGCRIVVRLEPLS